MGKKNIIAFCSMVISFQNAAHAVASEDFETVSLNVDAEVTICTRTATEVSCVGGLVPHQNAVSFKLDQCSGDACSGGWTVTVDQNRHDFTASVTVTKMSFKDGTANYSLQGGFLESPETFVYLGDQGTLSNGVILSGEEVDTLNSNGSTTQLLPKLFIYPLAPYSSVE